MSTHLTFQLAQQVLPETFCRRCHEHYCLAVTTILSIHVTSGGVLTYFRCPIGHLDFYMGGGQNEPRVRWRHRRPCAAQGLDLTN